MEQLDGLRLRYDGRFPKEAREIDFEFKEIDTKGIFRWRQGNTVVNTTIIQNREKQQFSLELNFLQMSRNNAINDRKTYEMKQKLLDIFSDLTGQDSQVEVIVDVVCDDGSVFSAIVNSISLACAHCGIPLSDMCLSITLNRNVDLCYHEEGKEFSICIVFLPNKEKIVYIESIGRLQKSEFEEGIVSAIEYCRTLHSHFRDICMQQTVNLN